MVRGSVAVDFSAHRSKKRYHLFPGKNTMFLNRHVACGHQNKAHFASVVYGDNCWHPRAMKALFIKKWKWHIRQYFSTSRAEFEQGERYIRGTGWKWKSLYYIRIRCRELRAAGKKHPVRPGHGEIFKSSELEQRCCCEHLSASLKVTCQDAFILRVNPMNCERGGRGDGVKRRRSLHRDTLQYTHHWHNYSRLSIYACKWFWCSEETI